MNGFSRFLQIFVQYIAEAFARIFGPSDDEYPNIGVQPFEGEPNLQPSRFD